jgi:hypothetical protein
LTIEAAGRKVSSNLSTIVVCQNRSKLNAAGWGSENSAGSDYAADKGPEKKLFHLTHEVEIASGGNALSSRTRLPD